MSASVVWTIAVCAAGTFLLRLIPITLYGQRDALTGDGGVTRRFLQAIGPAAIAALLVVSLWPTVADANMTGVAGTGAGVAVVVMAKRLAGGLALPTLLGAAVYGAWIGLLT